MAKPSIDLDQLAATGRRALARAWIDPADLPPKYRTPQVYQMLASRLAGQLPSHLATSPTFTKAKAQIDAWAGAQALADTAARLIADPAIRSVAGPHLDWLLEHPAEAFKQLTQHSIDHPGAYRDGSPLRQALVALGEHETFHETHLLGLDEATSEVPEQTVHSRPASSGTSEAPSSSPGSTQPVLADRPPSPRRSPGDKPASYEQLIATPKLSASDWSRLTSLAEQRHPPEGTDVSDLPNSYFYPNLPADLASQTTFLPDDPKGDER